MAWAPARPAALHRPDGLSATGPVRNLRKILAVALAVGLAPGIAWRSDPAPRDWSDPVRSIAVPVERQRAGPVTLEKAWLLSSRSPRFGGYSGLLVRPGGDLVAASDEGKLMFLDVAKGQPVSAFLDRFLRRGGPEQKENFDIEAITGDPATGRVWMAKEMANAIQAFDADFRPRGEVRPPEMAHWGANGGPESLVRLSDGRFLVVRESAHGWFGLTHQALLFAGDPIAPGTPAPLAFEYDGPRGYDPVDMAQLPDGRILVLLRKLAFPFPPVFRSALAIADPREIAADKNWPVRLVATLGKGFPQDNFEGLAVEPNRDGSLRLWLVSDDNGMHHFQHTYLMRLRWRD